MTRDGMEQRSENIGDTGRREFNHRSKQQSRAVTPDGQPAVPESIEQPGHRAEQGFPAADIHGAAHEPDTTRPQTVTAVADTRGFQKESVRSAPREAPASVHDTIARYNKTQARRFTEEAAKPAEEPYVSSHLPTIEATEAPVEPTSESASQFVTPSDEPVRGERPARTKTKPAGRRLEERRANAPQENATPRGSVTHSNPPTERRVSGSSYQQRKFEELRSDAQPAEPAGEAERLPVPRASPEEPQTQQTPQTTETPADRQPPAREKPLSHEHAPRSAPDRPRRLLHDRTPSAPKDAPRRKPTSPNAAKYIPPAGAAAATTAPATGQRDIPEPSAAGPDSGGTPATSPAETPGAAQPKPSTDGGSARSKTDKPGKLRFSGDETVPAKGGASDKQKPPPGRKLEKAQGKAERSAEKLDKARDNLPKKKRPKIQRSYEESTQKTKRKLAFEEEVKSQHAHLKGSPVTRPFKSGGRTATRFVHSKVFQVEHENVGTQAAHKAEMLAEGGLRTAYRLHKTAPYRKVEKLTRRTTKLNMKASYQKALNDNPKLKSNMFSRMAQKRKIKRQYAKAMRDAKKTGQNLKNTGNVLTKVGQAVVRMVARHPLVFAIIGGIFLIIVIFSSLFTSCSNMGTGIGGFITATSYLACDADVDNAELAYTEWETDLLIQINRTETDYPGYDEYRYQVDNVGHNPYELMAFLTALYQEFTYSQAEAVLRQIFAEQYQLTFTPTVETRYKTVTKTDPDTGESYQEQEAYDWHVMTVTLASRSFSDVIYSHMNNDQRQHYAILMQSKGNRQYSASPFDFNWLPYVSSYYGYRVHPITGVKDYHMGIDIAVPVGTNVLAGHDGTVIVTYDSGYGNYIVLTGADGLITKYAHLDSVLVTNGQTVTAGTVIAKSGNSGSSTGPHLHFEVIKDGQYLNPAYFTLTNDNGSFPVYGNAGAPMGDGSYAALIAQAESHLGKPYVWGAFGPNSFDCSGFVSYVLINSGVKNTGRLTAQGFYNICTPISPSEAQPGDLIFFTGTYSAAHPVTHVGIYVGNGMMIHAGNPVSYASINTSYWQSKFYAFGRLN